MSLIVFCSRFFEGNPVFSLFFSIFSFSFLLQIFPPFLLPSFLATLLFSYLSSSAFLPNFFLFFLPPCHHSFPPSFLSSFHKCHTDESLAAQIINRDYQFYPDQHQFNVYSVHADQFQELFFSLFGIY